MDCSLPGSSVLGISQARILEWVAVPSPEQKVYTHKLIQKMTLKEIFECSQVGAEDQQFRWNCKLNAVTLPQCQFENLIAFTSYLSGK